MRISYKIKLSQLYPITGLLHLHLSVKVFQHFCFKISSIVLKYILFSSTEAQKTHQITASASILLPILMPKISISGIPIIANIIYLGTQPIMQSQEEKRSGITNLWIIPEPVRASQSHPKSPRAWQEPPYPRITQSQLEPTREEPGKSQWKFNIKEVLREKLNSYSFCLIQIVNFFSTSCLSNLMSNNIKQLMVMASSRLTPTELQMLWDLLDEDKVKKSTFTN